MLFVEQSLVTAGLAPIAGVDEAGRGACAGPLVIDRKSTRLNSSHT